MDIDDIPVLRALATIAGVAKALLMFGAIFIFPAMAFMEFGHARASKFHNEKRYHQVRMWGWIFHSHMIIMLFQSMFYNLFNKWWVSPMNGDWLFVSWFFTKVRGEDLFWTELTLMFWMGLGFQLLASLMGTTNSAGEFLPRLYKRMH